MQDLVIGLDGGGSGCRARLLDASGRVLGAASGGPANLLRGDGAAPFAAILDAARGAVRAAGLPEDALNRCRAGLGVAGATELGVRRFFARRPPFAETRVVSDAHAAALGAHGGADGGVAILGTGAAACVVRDGAAREIGGWGFAADDLGSGADIGRRTLRAALRSHDAPGPPSAFAAAVLARFDGDPWAAVDWSASADPGAFGALAPLAFDLAEDGLPEARAIVDRAALELARLVSLCRAHGAERVTALGSVAARLVPLLPEEDRAALVPPRGDAVDGAALAVRMGLGTAS